MKPVTRRTLFRIILAICLFDAGTASIARQALPKKYKLRYWNPYKLWRMRRITAKMLVIMHNNMVVAQLERPGYGKVKIGDTFTIRRPARYAGRVA